MDEGGVLIAYGTVRARRSTIPWLAMSLSLVACVPTEPYRRHGRTHEMSRSSIVLYEAALKTAERGPEPRRASEFASRCAAFLRLEQQLVDLRDPGVSPKTLLREDRELACARAARAAREEERAAAERAAEERARDAEEAARRERAARERELRQEERRRSEAATRERERREKAQALRAQCKALSTHGTYEDLLAGSLTPKNGEDPVVALTRAPLQLKAGLSACAKGNEFERRRCARSRDAVHRRSGQTVGIVELRPKLGEYDFKKRQFEIQLPRRGWVTFLGSDVQVVTDGSARRVVIDVQKLAVAEDMRRLGEPLVLLLVRGRYQHRPLMVEGVPRAWLKQLGRARVKAWHFRFETVGSQVLNPLDGSVLISTPPNVDAGIQVAVDCAAVETNARRRTALVVRAEIRRWSWEIAVPRWLGRRPQQGDPWPFWRSRGEREEAAFGTLSDAPPSDAGVARPGNDVIIGEPTLHGPLTEAAIRNAFRRWFRAIEECVDALPERQPKLVGRVVVSLQVREDGQVRHAKVVESALGNPAVEACVVRTVESWQFPENEVRSLVQVPFNFRP